MEKFKNQCQQIIVFGVLALGNGNNIENCIVPLNNLKIQYVLQLREGGDIETLFFFSFGADYNHKWLQTWSIVLGEPQTQKLS